MAPLSAAERRVLAGLEARLKAQEAKKGFMKG
jgi:hypothetical protein